MTHLTVNVQHADVGSIDEAVFQAEVEAAEAAFLSNPPEVRKHTRVAVLHAGAAHPDPCGVRKNAPEHPQQTYVQYAVCTCAPTSVIIAAVLFCIVSADCRRAVLTATPETRERFSKIKLSNPKVQEKIVRVPGALDILKVCRLLGLLLVFVLWG